MPAFPLIPAASRMDPELQQLRDKLAKNLHLMPLPSNRLEKWRYVLPSTFARMAELIQQLPSAVEKIAIQPQLSSKTTAIYFDGQQLIIPRQLHEAGLVVEPLLGNKQVKSILSATQLAASLQSTADSQEDCLTLYNTVSFDNGLFIHIPSHLKLNAPLHLKISAKNQEICNWRHIIDVNKNAEITLLIEGDYPSQSWMNQVFQYNLAAQANMQLYHFFSSNPNLMLTEHHAARLDQAANLHMFSCMKGSGFIRQQTTMDLIGADARCNLAGIHITQENHQHHYVTAVNHRVAHTHSQQNFKGILQHMNNSHSNIAARASFLGGIYVAPSAIKTDASQSYKALLLSPEAGVFAKPELEIYADDVKCSHGTATGAVDENMLFYLRSRGLDYDEAVSLITRGFLQDITGLIADPSLRQTFLSLILQ